MPQQDRFDESRIHYVSLTEGKIKDEKQEQNSFYYDLTAFSGIVSWQISEYKE